MSPVWVTRICGLCVLLGLLYTPAVRGTPELDPSAPNVCSRTIRETKLILANRSMSCWKTEYTEPPCEGDFWFWWPRTDRPHRRGSHHYRWKRQASTTPNPTYSTTREPWYDRPRCCRKVLDTCWFTQELCILITRTKFFCCNGYEQDGLGGCKLEIECSIENGGCNQLCFHDHVEGHYCSCFSGYDLIDDTTCKDEDECAVNNGGCNQECVNVPGAYYCTCRTGYILTSPHQCTEFNECEASNGGCDQKCVNTDGGYYCECEEGLKLVNGSLCADENECQVNNGGCSDQCVNEYGGYNCQCPEGMYLDETGYTCIFEDTIMEPDVLPVSSAAQVMSSPPVYGSILGCLVLVVLLIILGVCCRRRCRHAAAPAGAPAALGAVVGAVFVVGKKEKQMMVLGVGSDLGEKPPLDDDAESIDFDQFETDEKKENLYTNPPSLAFGTGEPPPYVRDPLPYDDVIPSGRPYEHPGHTQPAMQNAYTNLAYHEDELPNREPGAQEGSHVPTHGSQEAEQEEGEKPFAEAIKKLRTTGLLESLPK